MSLGLVVDGDDVQISQSTHLTIDQDSTPTIIKDNDQHLVHDADKLQSVVSIESSGDALASPPMTGVTPSTLASATSRSRTFASSTDVSPTAMEGGVSRNGHDQDPSSDGASFHSLPGETTANIEGGISRRPSTALTADGSHSSPAISPPPSPSRSASTSQRALATAERRHRGRNTNEGRSSSRLSGFLTHLIHRRDGATSPTPRVPSSSSSAAATPPVASPTPRRPGHSSPSTSASHAPNRSENPDNEDNAPSRSSSPQPAARPSTPPPSLPPPTLRELGLSLAAITSELAPSHFSTPPTSGAFLGPHYLLLCHAQGLDVLPLQSPPAPQPYALVRRVAFKSVVIMEHRGVVVAIAGRRDGVRVYALEEVKRAVEWRMQVEIMREREKMRREAPKKPVAFNGAGSGGVGASVDLPGLGSGKESRTSENASRKSSTSLSKVEEAGTPGPGVGVGGGVSVGADGRKKLHRRSSVPAPTSTRSSSPPASSEGFSTFSTSPPQVLIPRTPTMKRVKNPRNSMLPPPSGSPPSYDEAVGPSASASDPEAGPSTSPPAVEREPSNTSLRIPAASRRASVVGVLTRAPSSTILPNGTTEGGRPRDRDSKLDWMEVREGDEDEAIDVVAAGASGSQALDERTSSNPPHRTHRTSDSVSSAGPAHTSTPSTTSQEASAETSSTVQPSNTSTSSGSPGRARSSSGRRNRPANLDLTLTRIPTSTTIVPPEPSPAPTLLSLRQALSTLDSSTGAPSSSPVHRTSGTFRRASISASTREPQEPIAEVPMSMSDADDDDDEPGGLSLAEMLNESRLPDLPPAGTRRPQQPIWIMSSHPVATSNEGEEEDAGGRSASAAGHGTRSPSGAATTAATRGSRSRPSTAGASVPTSSSVATSVASGSTTGTQRSNTRRRRRWSVFDGVLQGGSQDTRPTSPTDDPPDPPSSPRSTGTRRSTPRPLARSNSHSTSHPTSGSSHSLTSLDNSLLPPPPIPPVPPPPLPDLVSTGTPTPPPSSARSRFLPRIISNAFNNRRGGSNDDGNATGGVDVTPGANGSSSGLGSGRNSSMNIQAPPPKLEYVKLPGTKGALAVKAVETSKKSFLAILCGENGEKVELFAGTYRTALGLSRTFILPDSPRSLELQLQGDDLVEVFLVFSQNVFGLEPATVRVREVRIGRAERRAARRRARELRGEANLPEGDNAEDDVNVNVSIGVSVAVNSSANQPPGTNPARPADGDEPSFIPSEHPNGPHTPADPPPSAAPTPAEDSSAGLPTTTPADELIHLVTAKMGPYTTFQQLAFSPNFPLASIADEYIIPPTYRDFLEYRAAYEPDVEGNPNVDLSQVQFSPPGLPVPVPSAPSRWFYRDPKGVIHGPWKATLMQSWYKDGLLPPDLPVRKEEDEDYILLKDLRLQSVDPTHPFRPTPAPRNPQPLADIQETSNPLLRPVSLLAQPRHFGPPALFFSSRGGHSTAIVDARGRSVLKGRFVWSGDDKDEAKSALLGKMGDVKRLEAFDVKNRSVLVAMRQGGLEAVDLADALLRSGDESRTVLPHFTPPVINRRHPFVWRIGTPLSSSPLSAMSLSKHKGHGILSSSKKQSASSGKSPLSGGNRNDQGVGGDGDGEVRDEVLFLGRKNDELYICERNAGSFRVLRLSPYES